MIGLCGAYKSFGEKVILSDVTLEIPDGAFVCLTGGSGCGKTTLLRILAGLDTLDSGEISCGKVSYAFQEPRLFLQINVLRNAAVNGNEDKAKVLLDRLGLADSLTKYPSQLSGGMRQRVSVARALAFDASVYLFDEPTAALDQANALSCAEIIRDELRGKTVIVATHSDLFRGYADMLLRMDNGGIAYE